VAEEGEDMGEEEEERWWWSKGNTLDDSDGDSGPALVLDDFPKAGL
jgi:hypothetical protein